MHIVKHGALVIVRGNNLRSKERSTAI